MTLTGTTAAFIVNIDGESRFEGWEATSTDGADSVIAVKIDA
jgi:hypothetical protein